MHLMKSTVLWQRAVCIPMPEEISVRPEPKVSPLILSREGSGMVIVSRFWRESSGSRALTFCPSVHSVSTGEGGAAANNNNG